MSDKKEKKDKKGKKDAHADSAETVKKDGEGEEGGEEQLDLDGKKKGLKPIIIIAAAVLLLGGAGAGVYFSGMLDGLLGKTEATGEHGEEAAAEGGEHGESGGHDAKPEKKKEAKKSGGGGHGGGGDEAAGTGFMPLPDLIVNLSTGQGQPRYLKLKVQLELMDPADQPEVEKIAPRVIDHFQTYLRELRVSDLRGSAGIYRLRQELLARVNAAAAPVEVKDVLFQEILIQ